MRLNNVVPGETLEYEIDKENWPFQFEIGGRSLSGWPEKRKVGETVRSFVSVQVPDMTGKFDVVLRDQSGTRTVDRIRIKRS